MASFKGQEEYSVDDKGRVAIPAKMRRAMSPEANETFVLTRGFEKCVYLYPMDRWEEIEADMRKLSPYKSDARRVIRNMMRWAEEVKLDGQGRIRLTERLKVFAGIEGQAALVGAMDRIEAWDPETLEAHFNEDDVEDYETLAESVLFNGDGVSLSLRDGGNS